MPQAPATLPADFDFSGPPPATLPADFNFETGAAPKPPQGTDPRARFARLVGAFGEGLVVDTVKGLANAVRHPVDTVTGIVDATNRAGEQGRQSWKEGKPAKAVAETLMAAIPVVGPMMNDIGNATNQAIKDKNPEAVARNIGQAVAVVGAPEVPGALNAASKSKAALMTKGAAKGAVQGAKDYVATPGKPVTAGDVAGGFAMEGVAHLLGVPPGVAHAAKLAVKTGPSVYRGIVKGVKDELTALKTAEHRSANPGAVADAVERVPLPDASPIPGDLPSGRRPPTREEAAARAEAPTASPAPAVTQELLDGIAAGQMKGKKFAKLSKADQKVVKDVATRVVTPEPVAPTTTTPGKPSPAELKVIEQEFAAEVNPQQAPKPKPTDFEAGARAKKVWNISDKLHSKGWTTETLGDISQEELLLNISELNGEIMNEWKAAGMKGKKPQLHGSPSVETIQQIVKEMAETEARKAAQ